MDTKKLVVGQSVWLRSGRYSDWGKVVEITPTGVVVQHMFEYPIPDGWEPKNSIIFFDNNGIACESADYKGGFWRDSKIPGTKDGPTKLYRDPFV